MPTFTVILEARVDASDVNRAIAALDEAANLESGPFLDAFDESTEAYMAAMQTRYAAASAGDGTWDELKPQTVRRKARKALAAGIDPESILRETDTLRESLYRGAQGHVDERIPRGIRRGTSDRKAAIHHNGNPSRNIPARPVLAEPDGDTLQTIANIQADGVRRVIAAAVGTGGKR